MDLSQSDDDVNLEIATVLDEVSAVHCRIVKNAKMKKKTIPFSYFLQSAKESQSLQPFLKKKVQTIDAEYVDKIAGLGFLSAMEAISTSSKEQVEESTPSVSYEEEQHTFDMGEVEKFSGYFPQTVMQDTIKKTHSIPSKEPYVDDQKLRAQSPPVDMQIILTAAKQYFTEDDILKLHNISKTLTALEDKKHVLTVTPYSSPLSSDEEKRDRLVSITEDSSPDTEPEDAASGWLVSPKVYGDAGPVEIVDDFQVINETANIFVENIVTEADIVVRSWLRAMEHAGEKATLFSRTADYEIEEPSSALNGTEGMRKLVLDKEGEKISEPLEKVPLDTFESQEAPQAEKFPHYEEATRVQEALIKTVPEVVKTLDKNMQQVVMMSELGPTDDAGVAPSLTKIKSDKSEVFPSENEIRQKDISQMQELDSPVIAELMGSSDSILMQDSTKLLLHKDKGAASISGLPDTSISMDTKASKGVSIRKMFLRCCCCCGITPEK